MVACGRGASCCHRPMGCCSCFTPSMSGRFGVGRLACGLFIVGLFFCSSLVGPRLCQPSHGRLVRRGVNCAAARARMLLLLSSPLVMRFVVAGLSDVVVVLRSRCARRIVLVRDRCGSQWSARPGLCSGPYGPGWPRLVAAGCPLRHLFPVKPVLSWLARLRRVRG